MGYNRRGMKGTLLQDLSSGISATLLALGRAVADGEEAATASVERGGLTGAGRLTADEHRLLADAAPCTGCEACNAVCPLVATANATEFSGPMEIALRLARNAPDFTGGAAAVRVFDRCGSCRACEQCCPQQIPILGLVAVMRATLARRQLDDQETGTDRDRLRSRSGPG